MSNYNLYTILFYLFLFFSSNAQTGPGGVGSNDGTSDLVLWYRPDNGITTTAAGVTNWTNSAGYAVGNLIQVGGSFPQLISGSVNGYDEIQFDAVGVLQTATGLNTTNFVSDQTSTFIHAKANSLTQSFPYSAFGASNTRFLSHIPWIDSRVYFDFGVCCNANTRVQVGGLTGLFNYSLWSYDAINSTGKQLYRNGNVIANTPGAGTFIPATTTRFLLGRQFDGNITETIVFKSKINMAQRLIIQNYISAKYNQPLAMGDLYTQDNAASGFFDHHVAGIGQATDGSNHTDSQGTGIVRINTPSTLSNGDFLFWGEQTKNPVYNFATNLTSFTEQLNSKWRVSKVNDLGSVTVTFDTSSIDLSGKQSCQNLQLVVDNDSDLSSPTNTYNLTITGNTATATGVIFNDGDYFTLQYLDQIVWDGSAFFNGSGALNAPSNTDSCLKMTVKPGAIATLNTDLHVREIEVETGAVLEVNNGYLLQVENQIETNGIIDLLGESQLIQRHSNTTTNSGNGFLKIKQQGVSNLYNYNYWSAPVNTGGFWQIANLEDNNGIVNFNTSVSANPATTPITLSSRWLYAFKGTASTFTEWSALTPLSNLTPAHGYTMKGSGALTAEQEYIFKGTPNDGNYTIAVNAGNDFLTGNPYPSSLNADQFINDNLAVIDGTLFFWEQFSTNNSHNLRDYQGGYATYTMAMALPAVADASGLTSGMGINTKTAPTQNINVGQGFFVNIENSGNLVFNNQQRAFALESLGETIFFKNNTKKGNENVNPKIIFSFTRSNLYTKYIGLAYNENASKAYDKGYDAKTKTILNNDIFWKLNDDKLIIQALNNINTEDELPLVINITDSDTYEFSIGDIKNFPTDLSIYLKDNEQNIYYDLKSNPATLNLSANDAIDKFSITFVKKNTLSTEDIKVNTLSVFYNSENEKLYLNGFDNIEYIKSLSIITPLGQEVLKLNDVKSHIVNMSGYSNGLYFIKINSKDHKISKSIKFIKN